jgi:hypothetical protein
MLPYFARRRDLLRRLTFQRRGPLLASKVFRIERAWSIFNGHFRILAWRYLPYIRPIF